MATWPQFFDMSVSVSPPGGHLEPLPITLGPNWKPNDLRIVFVSASGSESSGSATIDVPLISDPPATFTAAYSLNPGNETHGVYFRRLVSGDNDQSVYWPKPAGWTHFMFGMMTVRGVDPGTNPTAGSLSVPGGITYTTADTTNSLSVSSVSVPRAGTMVFFLGSVVEPEQVSWPHWPVAIGIPSGWAPLVSTDKSGATYYQYDTNPSLVTVAKSFSSSGSTGSVVFPAGQGSPAFSGLYAFFTPAPDVSVTLSPA